MELDYVFHFKVFKIFKCLHLWQFQEQGSATIEFVVWI